MRKRILSLLACVVVLAFGGFAAAQMSGASAATTPDFGPGYVKGASVAIKLTAPRGEYRDANGIHHCLQAGPNALTSGRESIGDYPGMAFLIADPGCDWGTGSKTTPPPAVTPIKVVHKTLVLTADSPATQELILTGLPGFQTTSAPYEVNGDNTADLPATFAPGSVTAVAKAPNPGATTRAFTVTSALTGTQKFVLDVWVLAVTP